MLTEFCKLVAMKEKRPGKVAVDIFSPRQGGATSTVMAWMEDRCRCNHPRSRMICGIILPKQEWAKHYLEYLREPDLKASDHAIYGKNNAEIHIVCHTHQIAEAMVHDADILLFSHPSMYEAAYARLLEKISREVRYVFTETTVEGMR